MKNLIFLLIFSTSINAFAIEIDTIIINVGSKQKVILYGETKADLRELEKFDLNKAVKKMNEELSKMPVKTEKMVVKDYDGNTYKKAENEIDMQSGFQKFVKNTHFNINLGMINFEVRDVTSFENPKPNTSTGYLMNNYGSANQSRYFGLDLLHSTNIRLDKHLRFNLKKGFGYTFYQLRGTNPYNGALNLIPSILFSTNGNSFPLSTSVVKKEDYYEVTRSFQGGTSSQYKIYPSKIRVGMVKAQIQPTLIWIDKKGRESYKLAFGLWGGRNIHSIEKLNFRTIDDKKMKAGALGVAFGDYYAGTNLSVGYKMINLFWEQTFASSKGRISAQSIENTTNKVGSAQFPARVGYTAIGLRLGR
jgi:hypothetical protein